MNNKEIYFIVNKHSRTGKGALIWNQIENKLRENGVAYKAFTTEYRAHAQMLAVQISQMKEEQIDLYILGGDGTINEVINGIQDFDKVRVGIIPTGSGNDLARGLGIKRTPIEQLEYLINSTKTETYDLGKVSWNNESEHRLFTISSGIGMDAIVCKKALTSRLKKALNKIHLGKLTYLLITLQTLFSMETVGAKGTVDDRNVIFSKMIFSAAMNFKAEGGGVPMAPEASPKDGKLSICAVSGIPKGLTLFALPFLVAGKHANLPGFRIMECDRMSLELSRPFVLHADGEYCGDVTDPVFTIIPNKLKVIS